MGCRVREHPIRSKVVGKVGNEMKNWGRGTLVMVTRLDSREEGSGADDSVHKARNHEASTFGQQFWRLLRPGCQEGVLRI